MNLLDRYIIRTIYVLTALVGLSVTTIYAFTAFVGDLGDTGRGRYGIPQLLAYTLLNLPTGLALMVPIIAMLGTLLGLGQLAAQNELTAIRAAGVSNLRLGATTALAGLLIAVLAWVLGDWVAPGMRASAEALRSRAQTGSDAGALSKPVWLREGDNIVRVGRLLSATTAERMTIYRLDGSDRLASIVEVERAQFADGRWLLHGVQRTSFAADRIQRDALPELEWSGGLSPEVLHLFVLEARSLSVDGLLRLIDYMDSNGLDAARQRLDLWKKLVAPATIMAMMLFVVPFVFGSMRSSGTGVRLLIGIVVGVGFYVVNEVSANLGLLYRWHPGLAAGLPTLLLVVVGLWRLQRAR